MTPEQFKERLMNEVLGGFIVIPQNDQTKNGQAIGRLRLARMITQLVSDIANQPSPESTSE